MSPLKARRRIWLSLCGAGALTLAGCATPRPAPTDTSAFWSGRLALQLNGASDQQWSASFELQGAAEQGQLTLLSPMGTALARLSWSPQSAVLEQGQERTESASLQSLSQRLTGTTLPMAALFAWLAGQEAEAPGWQVDLSGYRQGRVSARASPPQAEAVLRIVLDR